MQPRLGSPPTEPTWDGLRAGARLQGWPHTSIVIKHLCRGPLADWVRNRAWGGPGSTPSGKRPTGFDEILATIRRVDRTTLLPNLGLVALGLGIAASAVALAMLLSQQAPVLTWSGRDCTSVAGTGGALVGTGPSRLP